MSHTHAVLQRTQAPLPLWVGVALSELSAILLILTMPGYTNISIIGWFALVPLLLSFELFPNHKVDFFTLPFGLVLSLGVHSWYLSIFGWWGALLIIGAGVWYAAIIGLGIKAQRAAVGIWKLFALPIIWSGLEFLKFTAPIVRDWWFVPLANSQWQFPAALQVLSIKGFPGLSFLLMLVNVALTALIVNLSKKSLGRGDLRLSTQTYIVLVFSLCVVLWGALVIAEPEDTFAIIATSDLANGPDIQQYSNLAQSMEGYYADTPEMSQALFDVNAELTRQAAQGPVAFVVWPENEFADADDPTFMDQVGALAQEVDAYLVVDTVWRTSEGMHDAAVLIGPSGNEVGRRAKVHLFSGEKEFGFLPGPRDWTTFATDYGLVGLGVCYDYHFTDVAWGLARNGAAIMLMPTDDDINGNAMFPYYHAADTVFRAVEHRVAFAAAGTNGVSLVVDPFGRVTAMGGVNERTVVKGETFTVAEQTMYTRFGNWFGWLMAIGVLGLGVMTRKSKS